jgi:hypothetical protein
MLPKIKFIGKVEPLGNPAYLRFRPSERVQDEPKALLYNVADSATTPVQCGAEWPGVWIYKGKAFRVEDPADRSPEEVAACIEHLALTSEREHEAEYERIKVELVALKNLERTPEARRERIPESVQIFIWQRDQGQCVQCRSKERLEFDHIIPVAKGGSNTGRNIQLLCEACNRKKGKRIGF